MSKEWWEHNWKYVVAAAFGALVGAIVVLTVEGRKEQWANIISTAVIAGASLALVWLARANLRIADQMKANADLSTKAALYPIFSWEVDAALDRQQFLVTLLKALQLQKVNVPHLKTAFRRWKGAAYIKRLPERIELVPRISKVVIEIKNRTGDEKSCAPELIEDLIDEIADVLVELRALHEKYFRCDKDTLEWWVRAWQLTALPPQKDVPEPGPDIEPD